MLTALAKTAILLELHGGIWNNEGQTLFPVMPADGTITCKAVFFLAPPAPTCTGDGIELLIDEADFNEKAMKENIEQLIKAKRG